MAANIRVGRTHGYLLHREVEPVPAYPRINSQQPRDQYRQQQESERSMPDGHVERRFTAMRRLVDKLKVTGRIARVDYMTAEQELVDLGLARAHDHLAGILQDMRLSSESIEESLEMLGQRSVRPELRTGRPLEEEGNFLPVFVPGLLEYGLLIPGLKVALLRGHEALADAIRKDGRHVLNQGCFRFDLYLDPSGVDPTLFFLI